MWNPEKCGPLWSGQKRMTRAPAAVPWLSLLSPGELGQSNACGTYLSARCSRDGLCWHISQMPQGAWQSLSRYTRKESQKRRRPQNYRTFLARRDEQQWARERKIAALLPLRNCRSLYVSSKASTSTVLPNNCAHFYKSGNYGAGRSKLNAKQAKTRT
jgi:hypothetical protein